MNADISSEYVPPPHFGAKISQYFSTALERVSFFYFQVSSVLPLLSRDMNVYKTNNVSEFTCKHIAF